jgi:hypothetical protein
MSNELNRLLDQLGGEFSHLMAGLGGVSHNRYTLTVDGLTAPISVLHVDGDEQLNQSWRYVVTFTSPDKTLSPDAFLNQKSSLVLLKMSPKLASRFIINRFIVMAGLKIITVFATWWVQLFSMALEFVWTLIADDDIQKWIRATRFGTQYDRNVSPNFDAELTAFKKLMKIEESQEEVEQDTDSFLTYIGWDSSILSDLSFNDILGINSENNSKFQLNPLIH